MITAVGVLTLGAAGTAVAAENGGTGDQPAASAQGQRAHHGARLVAFMVAVQAATATIGVEVSELRAAVKGGQTVGAFAESRGVSSESVVGAIVNAIGARIDQAVADGKLPADRAANVKERVPELADRFVNTLPKRFQSSGQALAQG